MNKGKVTDLAKSFSEKCKQTINENQIAQKIATPQIVSLAVTLMIVVADVDPGFKGRYWAT